MIRVVLVDDHLHTLAARPGAGVRERLADQVHRRGEVVGPKLHVEYRDHRHVQTHITRDGDRSAIAQRGISQVVTVRLRTLLSEMVLTMIRAIFARAGSLTAPTPFVTAQSTRS